MNGSNNGKEGVLIPGSINVGGFGKVFAEIAPRDGAALRCRAEDLERIE